MMQCSTKLACGHRCVGTYHPGNRGFAGEAYYKLELCSDPCKCQTCDRRAGGHRSMLKPITNGASSTRAQASTSHNLLLDTSFQAPANPPPPSGSPGKWHAYVNGGAQADDARLLQKHREAAFDETRQNATPRPSATTATEAGASIPGRLIDTSPRKPVTSVSGNTKLLVDLDINAGYESYRPRQFKGPYASAARSAETTYAGSEWSLLD
jgi:helicase required for RNAi-mediated heterochromatin assembly 1